MSGQHVEVRGVLRQDCANRIADEGVIGCWCVASVPGASGEQSSTPGAQFLSFLTGVAGAGEGDEGEALLPLPDDAAESTTQPEEAFNN